MKKTLPAMLAPASALLLSAAHAAGPDLGNCRVDFSKLHDTFADLELSWTVRAGISELVDSFSRYGLTSDDFTSSRFVRLRRIVELQELGHLDGMLRSRATTWPPASPMAETHRVH